MSRTYRRWSPEQVWMFPPSPRDWLPENPLDSFLMDVTGQVDLSPIFAHDEQGKAGGQPPFHPRMMVTLFIYAYCTGIFSSRKIMARCQSDAAFRVIVGEDIPDFRTISDFRRIPLPVMKKLFAECMPKHRHQEWIRFLKKIDAETPAELDLHLIVDNDATHKHPKVQNW